MMILEIAKNSWSYNEDFNLKIDFCIWTLKLDGLHVPPFDKHPEGNRVLRDVGLDAEAWRAWFAKVVATQDPLLLGSKTYEEQQERIKAYLTSMRAAKSQLKLKINEQAERTWLENHLLNQNQQYQLAAARAEPFCRRCEPPNIWLGNPEVGELLWDLWQHYLIMREEESFKQFEQWQQAEQMSGMRKLWQGVLNSWRGVLNGSQHAANKLYRELQQYHTRLATLNIYQVDYPAAVEYLVPPVSLILPVGNGKRYSDAYRKRVLNGAESLAALSSS